MDFFDILFSFEYSNFIIMKTDKHFFMGLILLCISIPLSAQKDSLTKKYNRWNLQVNAGYGFPCNKTDLFTNSTTSNGVITSDLVTGSYGKGFELGAGINYRVYRKLSAGLNVNYLLGGSYTQMNKSTYFGTDTYDEYICRARTFRVNPTLQYNFFDDDCCDECCDDECNISPFIRVGASIGLGTQFREDFTSTNTINSGQGVVTNTTTRSENYSGGIGFGYTGAFGVTYPIGKKMTLFGEWNFNQQVWRPLKSVLTESTYNGQSNLDDLPVSSREVKYVDQIIYDPMINPEVNVPSQQLKRTIPLNSSGFQFGLNFKF